MTRHEQDAEKIRRALEACLSGVDMLPSRRAEILRKARGEQIVKKKISTGMIAVLVAMVLVVGATAMSVNQGLVNQQGDPQYLLSAPNTTEGISNEGYGNTPTADVVYATSTPPPVPTAANETVQYFRTPDPMPFVTATPAPDAVAEANKAFVLGQTQQQMDKGTVKVMYYTPAAGEVGISVGTSSAMVTSYEALCAELEGQTRLPLPVSIPEGYSFAAAQVFYGCTTDTEYTLAGMESNAAGLVVQYYRPVSKAAVFVQGYTLFCNGSGSEQLICNVVLHNDYEGMRFDLWEQEQSERITIAGMTDALTITGGERNRLYMHQPLGYEVAYIATESFISVGNPERAVDTYNEVVYSLMATDLTVQELIALYPAGNMEVDLPYAVRVTHGTADSGEPVTSVEVATKTVGSYEELQAELSGQHALRLISIPEGYTYLFGQAYYHCTSGDILVHDKELPDGSIEEYYLPQDMSSVFVSGYTLVLQDDNGDQLMCNATMGREAEAVRSRLWSQDGNEHVQVPGMADAMSITDELQTRVYMQQMLEAEIIYTQPSAFAGADSQETAVFDEVVYTLQADAFAAQELIRMVTGEAY